MYDFKAALNIAKSVAIHTAKITHNPSLSNKASMAAYAAALGTTGKKAIFTEEQKNESIEFVM